MVAARGDYPGGGASKAAQYSQCAGPMYMYFLHNDSIFHFSGLMTGSAHWCRLKR